MVSLYFHKQLFKLTLLIAMVCSCSQSDDRNPNLPNPDFNQTTIGTGFFEYNYQVGSFSKVMRIYYHIPESKTALSPILFVLHGDNRNAADYRNTMISNANNKGFIVIAPEFSNANFPGGDQYNLGNVYVDGDNPSANTLNPEGEWTFSIIEPLFDYIRTEIGNSNTSYKLFGHSAGAQFAHRFLMFKPNNRANQSVISAAGWYTFPDVAVNFPYGFGNSILQNTSEDLFFAKELMLQIGENDNNPNAPGLRHNQFADAQGLHRLDRATNFFNFSQQRAQTLNTSFNWTLHVRPNATHDYISASQYAAGLLF